MPATLDLAVQQEAQTDQDLQLFFSDLSVSNPLFTASGTASTIPSTTPYTYQTFDTNNSQLPCTIIPTAMTSHDIVHISYEEQGYSVDPSLYQHEDTSYYTAGEASTSYAQPYSQEPDTTEASPTSSDPNKCSVCGKFYRRKCDLEFVHPASRIL